MRNFKLTLLQKREEIYLPNKYNKVSQLINQHYLALLYELDTIRQRKIS